MSDVAAASGAALLFSIDTRVHVYRGQPFLPSPFLEEDTRERPPEIEKHLSLYIFTQHFLKFENTKERRGSFLSSFCYLFGTNECKGMIVLVRKLGYREDVKE